MMNQKGFVTTEFLFAIVIAFGLTILTFGLTFTLSTIEMAQYIIYSSSRAHVASNYSIEAQQEAARRKYTQLTNSSVMSPLFNNGWFEISKPSELDIRSGAGKNFEQDYDQSTDKHNLQGVRMSFTARLLEFQLPLIGKVTPEDDGFVARLSAVMIREVSHLECMQFMKDRLNAIKTLDNNRFSALGGSGNAPTPWEDNGC